MPSKPTSVAAYRELIESGQGRYKRDKIFECLMNATDVGIALTRDQLEGLTRIRINVVCGAVHALLEMDMIRIAFERKGPSGRVVEYLEVAPDFPSHREFQPELFDLTQLTHQKSRFEHQQ